MCSRGDCQDSIHQLPKTLEDFSDCLKTRRLELHFSGACQPSGSGRRGGRSWFWVRGALVVPVLAAPATRSVCSARDKLAFGEQQPVWASSMLSCESTRASPVPSDTHFFLGEKSFHGVLPEGGVRWLASLGRWAPRSGSLREGEKVMVDVPGLAQSAPVSALRHLLLGVPSTCWRWQGFLQDKPSRLWLVTWGAFCCTPACSESRWGAGIPQSSGGRMPWENSAGAGDSGLEVLWPG